MKRFLSIYLGLLLAVGMAGFVAPAAFAEPLPAPVILEHNAEQSVVVLASIDSEILADFNKTTKPAIVANGNLLLSSENPTLSFKDVDNNNAIRNFGSRVTQKFPAEQYWYDWPSAGELPLSSLRDLPAGFAFANNTLTADLSLFDRSEADDQDVTTKEFEITLQANTGYPELDVVLNKAGIPYLNSASFTVVLTLNDLPEGSGEGNEEGQDNNGNNGQVNNVDNGASAPTIDTINTLGQGNTPEPQNTAELIQNPVPELLDPQSLANTDFPTVQTQNIYDSQIPLMASPVGAGGNFGAANAGAAVFSVGISAVALYSLKKRPSLNAVAGPTTLAKVPGYLGIGFGGLSIAFLLLTQDVFSVGSGGSAINAMTPVFGTLVIVQVACLALQLFSKLPSKDANKHPRFKARF